MQTLHFKAWYSLVHKHKHKHKQASENTGNIRGGEW